MLRFDYSGHGLSSGNLLEASIGDWLEEASAVLGLLGKRRALIVGSSMGGWIALLLARHLARAGKIARLAGLVLIAPAWDMTERLMAHRMTPEIKATLERDGVHYEPSLYGDPYPITKHLIEEGRNHLIGVETPSSRSCRCASCKACAIPTCPGVMRSTLSISCTAATSSSPSSRTATTASRGLRICAASKRPSPRCWMSSARRR